MGKIGGLMHIQQVLISDLTPYGHNPRKNDAAVERMARAIEAYGFRCPVLARSDGMIIDGHLRFKAAQAAGMESVPVIYADDLSEEQVKAFRIMVNESANWAEWDEGKLRRELEELLSADYDLSLTGFNAEELSRMLDVAPLDLSMPDMPPLAPPDAYLPGDEANPQTETGVLPSTSVCDAPAPSSLSPPQERDEPAKPLHCCPKCGFKFSGGKA